MESFEKDFFKILAENKGDFERESLEAVEGESKFPVGFERACFRVKTARSGIENELLMRKVKVFGVFFRNK